MKTSMISVSLLVLTSHLTISIMAAEFYDPLKEALLDSTNSIRPAGTPRLHREPGILLGMNNFPESRLGCSKNGESEDGKPCAH